MTATTLELELKRLGKEARARLRPHTTNPDVVAFVVGWLAGAAARAGGAEANREREVAIARLEVAEAEIAALRKRLVTGGRS